MFICQLSKELMNVCVNKQYAPLDFIRKQNR